MAEAVAVPGGGAAPGAPPDTIQLHRLAPAPYEQIWDWQRRRAAAVAAGEAREALALVEHRPVYTLGPRTDPAHLLLDEAALRARGAEVCRVDRGGDVSWHGPGQLTGYPVLDLRRVGRDLHAYVTSLEALLIDVLAGFGVAAGRAPGRPGVWVGEAKVAAIGIKVARGWISYHGFALNVDPDLSWFGPIVPCGLHGYEVTSLTRILGRGATVEEVTDRLVPLFERRFGVRLASPG